MQNTPLLLSFFIAKKSFDKANKVNDFIQGKNKKHLITESLLSLSLMILALVSVYAFRDIYIGYTAFISILISGYLFLGFVFSYKAINSSVIDDFTLSRANNRLSSYLVVVFGTSLVSIGIYKFSVLYILIFVFFVLLLFFAVNFIICKLSELSFKYHDGAPGKIMALTSIALAFKVRFLLLALLGYSIIAAIYPVSLVSIEYSDLWYWSPVMAIVAILAGGCTYYPSRVVLRAYLTGRWTLKLD